MSTAERYLSFARPPVISSSEFTTEFIEYTPANSQRDFTSGDSFIIALSNTNKAQYLIPDHCHLTFDVVVSTAVRTAADALSVPSERGQFANYDVVPRPYWGCPYFEGVRVSVPGSADFNALPSDAQQTAAYFYSTRLLASSCTGEGSHDKGTTFRLPGRYNMAGGKSGIERATAITGTMRYKAVSDDSAQIVGVRGNSISMAIPLSAYCSLFSKTSSLIPVGMLSSGGDALSFSFTVARDVTSVLGTYIGGEAASNSGFAGATFTILNPRITCSVVRVQNPVTVAQLSSLYDGRVQMTVPSPAGPPKQITVPMVLAHKGYFHSSARIPKTDAPVINSSTPFSLTFSGVNQPSVSAVVLRFRYAPTSAATSLARRQCSSVFLGADEPTVVISDLQLRLNDQLIPLRGISDEGVSTVPVLLGNGTGAAPAAQAAADGSTIVVRSSSGIAANLFELGRTGLGLYMEDDHSASLADVVYDKDISFRQFTKASLDGAAGTSTTGVLQTRVVGARTYVEADPYNACRSNKSPISLFIIPLVSLPALVGDYSNAHTLRSYDLRSVSTFSVTGSIQVVDNGAAGGVALDPTSRRGTFVSSPSEPIICDGTLVTDQALRLAAGSSDTRYVYTMVANATVAAV